MSAKPLIYLADLTHTGQIVASNVAPLGIGLLASYLLKFHKDNVEIELFKYPADLNKALEKRPPNLIGFANYSWNLDLSYRFAERIKEMMPETIVVFGGPNYGLTLEEMADFWNRFPLIDFYVAKEGEIAFEKLYSLLAQNGFSAQKIKSGDFVPPNCHFPKDGEIKTGETLSRIMNLAEIGSPYLDGMMDKFFDGVLIPMIHTTRGCPFTCTFCSEGSKYYSKVAKRIDLKDELVYIAERKGSIQDLVITDANFGMFNEDKAKAETIKAIQEKYQWPRRVIVSTGKNQKEKIIEVAGVLKGALSIAASLQSTDATVLANINRSNISIEGLNAIVKQSQDVDATTYTEIILGLPGDTVETHTQSLRDVSNAGLGVVRMYQLILLPQTELNTPATREKFGMKTKFRINPRSFGKYTVLGKEIVSIEHEEILISNNTLSFQDYLHCRELDLTIEMMHNSGIFIELQGLCRWLNLSWFDFLLRYFVKRRGCGNGIGRLYDNFVKDSQVGLWDSREELENQVSQNIDAYLGNTDGTNEMAKSKAIAFFHYLKQLHDALYCEMESILADRGLSDLMLRSYLSELKVFSIMRKENFIDTSLEFKSIFHFNFFSLEKISYNADPRTHYHEAGVEYQFRHNQIQIDMMKAYVGQYGANTIDSLGRILMRAPAKRMFRDFSTDNDQYTNGNNRHSSLNVYGGFSV
ncbi:MAG: cobalamin-dependent protein [Fibrobacterota bacterium]|nr:cobalamin-dependent protein [Fibrobacterota bacterium]